MKARSETSCSSRFADSQVHWNFNRRDRDQSAHRRHSQLEQTPNSFFFFFRFIAVVAQYFEVQVYDQFAIRGNAAIFKCQVPSFVADHVDVVGWIDSNGGSYVADEQSYGSQKWKDAHCIVFLFFFLQTGRTQVLLREGANHQTRELARRSSSYSLSLFFQCHALCFFVLCV